MTLGAVAPGCSGAGPGQGRGGCETPADCPDPIAYSCRAGVCVALDGGCLTPADCPDPLAYACRDGVCELPAGGCRADSDCADPLQPICRDGECVECVADGDCQDPVRDTCLDGACASGTCGNDDECVDPLAPYCLEGSCVECRTAAHCPDPEGQRCEAGECAEAVFFGDGARPSSFSWTCPQTHSYCQAFGVPIDYQTCGFHTGLDIRGSDGEPIISLADGRVVYVGPLWLDGAGVGRGPYAIVVKHSPRLYSTYSHNRRALVAEGDCVSRGQTIAEMGDLGYSFGPHLHLEVLSGVDFTGDWQTPFSNACDHYEDPLDYAQP